MQKKNPWRLLAAVLVIVVGLLAGDSTHMKTVRPPAVTQQAAPPSVIAVDNADADAQPDNPVTLTPKARDVAQTLASGAATGTNDLMPKEHAGPPLSGKVTGPVAKLLPPFASDTVPGCRTRTLTANWSYRAPGTRVEAFSLHYTAGPDVPNSRSEVDGLTAFGDNPSSAVSWALNLDKDGNCDYNVPYRYKAWTIAGLNSVTVNAEIAGRGDAPYLRPAGYRELARIWVDFHRRYSYIPLALGATDGHCNITRPGIITHWMGGPCSGGHIDIKPLDIVAVIATLRKYVAAINCNAHCHQARRLRGIHRRTHQRFRKNDCNPHPGVVRHGYCDTLRKRNAAAHRAARRAHVSLAGTY